MQSLIAVIFKEDMDRAEAYRVELRGREELAGLVDCSKMVAAVCDKEGKVHLQYTHALAKDGALIGGVWGALIGFLFLNPLLGAALGAGAGAISGALTDMGIDDKFMKELAENFKPGCAAIFILVKKATPDKLMEKLTSFKGRGKILQTSLTRDEEQSLRAFIEAQPIVAP